MKLTGVKIAEITDTSKANISKLTKNGKLIRGDDRKYDTENKINLDYLLSHGITKKDIENYVLSGSKIKQEKKEKVKPSQKKTENKKANNDNVVVKSKKEKVNNNRKNANINSKKSKNSQKSTLINKKNEIKNQDIDEEEFENITGLPSKVMNMTMKKIVMRYGNQLMLDKYSTILNRLMQAAEKDQKVQERRLELINKDFCVSRLFLYLENLSQLLFDFPEGCIDNMIAKIESKKDNYRNEIVNDMRKELGILINQTKNNINRELDNLLSKYDKDKENDN